MVLPVALVALAAVPAFLMIRFSLTHGGNNFSDDYGHYIPFLTSFWNGTASWFSFLIGSVHGPHVGAIPLALRVAAVQLGHWDAWTEIYGAIAIAFARVGLVYLIFFRAFDSAALRAALLAAGSLAIFSPAQLSLFVYGDTGLTMGLDNLGFLLGLWGLARFPRSWAGVALACAGGLVSTWSWGVGIAWFVFLIAMRVHGYVSLKQYLIVVLVMVIAHAPLGMKGGSPVGGGLVSLFSPLYILGALGRPMSPAVDRIDQYGYAIFAGALGLLLAGLAIACYRRLRAPRGGPSSRGFTASWLLMAYGVLCIYQVSLIRDGVGSWYTALSTNFWIGLAALALVLLQEAARGAALRMRVAAMAAASGLLAVLGGLYAHATASFQHKTPFLQSRSLSAESCLRHYRDAPSFCELMVFMWQPTYEFAGFARFFESAQLSVFGARQVWTLQGDYPLHTVRLNETPGRSQVRWGVTSRENGFVPRHWASAERLGISVPPGTGVDWTVTLPAALRRATLKANVGWARLDSAGAHDAPLLVRIVATMADGQTRELYSGAVAPADAGWKSIDIALEGLAGNTMTLSLSPEARDARAGRTAVFRYPRLEIEQMRQPRAASPTYLGGPPTAPSNTELSPAFPRATARDAILETPASIGWKDLHDHVFRPRPEGASLCIGDYSHLAFRVGVPRALTKRMVRIVFDTAQQDGGSEAVTASLGFLEDDATHSYSYDLRLLGIDYTSRLKSVRMYSPWGGGSDEEGRVLLAMRDVRLIRKAGDRSFCEGEFAPGKAAQSPSAAQ